MQVANAVDDERLDRGGIGGGTIIPVADQQVGAEADAFPAEEQLQQVVRRHQHQHGEGEQRQIGEEAIARELVVRHVADGIDVDQHGDERHHRDHHRRQRVVAQCPCDVETAGLDPCAEGDDAGFGIARDKLEAGDRTERSGDQHAQDGNCLRGAIADRAAEQAGDQRSEQRREDRDGVDHAPSLVVSSWPGLTRPSDASRMAGSSSGHDGCGG